MEVAGSPEQISVAQQSYFGLNLTSRFCQMEA